jgi:hypothetical protein
MSAAEATPLIVPMTIGNANLVSPNAGSTMFAATPTTRPKNAPINISWKIRISLFTATIGQKSLSPNRTPPPVLAPPLLQRTPLIVGGCVPGASLFG